MIRLLVKFGSTVRRVANVDIANHDGSINLSLVRAGTNGYGWVWNPSRSDFDKVEYADPKPKTKRITIHTSGRVNIYLRGIVMGLSKKRIKELVDDVCEFADLGNYIHMPLRTYSSGMSMRLAFAMSTSIKADIILMDEWLSDGDAELVQKAEKRLQDMTQQAEIMVIASHNSALLAANCNRIANLEHGRIVSIS